MNPKEPQPRLEEHISPRSCNGVLRYDYKLYYVDDDATGPVLVGHFSYDDDKPKAYLDCTVVGVACIDGQLEATVRNPPAES